MASKNIFGSLTNTVKKITEEAEKKVKEEQEKSTGLQKTDSTGKSSISSTVTKSGSGTNNGSSTSNNTQKKTVTNADKLLSGVSKGVSAAANTVSKAATASGTQAAVSNTAKTTAKASNASKLVANTMKSGVANTTGKKTVKELVNQTMSNPELAKRETGMTVRSGIKNAITKTIYPNGKGNDNNPESGYKLVKSQVNPSGYTDHEGMGDDFFIRKKYGINDTKNVKEMSANQLSDWRARVNAGMQSAIQKTNAYNQLTDEEKQALKDETVATDIQAGRYTHLSVDGLPYMEVNGNMYAIGQDEEQAATGFLKSRPTDYYVGNNREDYDRIAYDYMNGIGSYDEYIWNMETDEDAEKLDAYMDDFWNRLETGGFTQAASETRDLMYQKEREASGDYNISGYEREMEKINDEAERQGTIEFYQRYAPNTGYVYNPDDLKNLGITYTSDFDKPVFKNKADEVFYYINEMTGEGLSDKMKYDLLQPEWFMTDEQKQTFNDWYSSGNKQAALAFYDALYNSGLRQVMLESKKQYEIELTRQGNVDMYIRRAVTPEVAGIASTVGAIGGGLFGVKAWQDPDAEIYDMTRTNQNIQTGSAAALGDTFANWFGENAREIGEQVANMGWSVTDNIRRQLVTKGVSTMFNVPMDSTFAKTVDYFLLGSDVVGNTMATELANNRSPMEALVRAVGEGMIEVFTENMWWDDVYGPKGVASTSRKAFNYLKSSFRSEGMEEVSGNVLHTIFDEAISSIFGHKSEIGERIDELTEKYETEENLDPEEAKKRAEYDAGIEWLKDAGISYLTGGLSALISGGGRVAADVYQTRKSDAKLGSDVLAHGVDTETADNKEKMAAEAKNEFTLIELGEGFKDGTLSKQLADKMRNDIRKGKEVSKADVGELVRSIVNESSEKVANVSKNILGDVFRSELNEKGEENADDLTDALLNIIVNGDASGETLGKVAGSQAAMDIIREYKMGKFSPQVASIEEQTATERAASKSVMEMLPQANDADVTADAVKKIVDGATVAATEDIRNAEGARTGNKGETVSEGKIADIASIALKKVDVETEGDDGKPKTEQQTRWQITMSDGRVVDIADVKATNQDVAETLAFLQNDSGQVVGQNLADAVMKIATTKKTGKAGGDMATTLSGAVRIMWAAATEQATPKISGMSAEDAAAITDAVKADLEESEKKRLSGFTVLAAGKGTTTLNGVAYGTNAFNEMVNKVVRDNNLGDNVKTEAQVIGSIAKTVGAQVELYYDANDTANQGMFTAGGGIRINLAGTTNKEGAHRSALATFAHEVTHNIEANSPDAYKALRSFVFTSLGGKLNIQNELSRIQAAYAHYGEHLDIAGAVSELVAKACETVLTDESVIRQLQEQDADLAGTVGDAVNELVDRVQSIKGDALTSASMYARAMGDVSRGLSQAWMGAYREAAGAKGTTTAAGSSEYSFAGTDPETGRSVYISDYKAGTPSSVKTQALIDTVQNLWSKKPITLQITENGKKRTIQANFDPDYDATGARKTDLGKMTHPEFGPASRRRVALNLSGDYYQILEESEYDQSKPEEKDHPGVNQWHYFVDDIYYAEQGEDEATPYRIAINIKEKDDGSFVYAYYPQRLENEQTKKLSVMGIKPVNTRVMSGESASASKRSITQGARKNNSQNSISDEAYMDAVRAGDMDEAQRIVDEAAEQALKDSKIRGEDGKLIRVYHNTDAEFNEFDTAKYGGKTGKAEGYGIYLTDDQETASNYGGRQIAAYANITRPAYGNKQTISRSELIKLIRASAEYQADSLAAEEDLYGEEATDRESLLRDTWLSNYTNTYSKSFDRACAEVADSILNYNNNDQDIIQEIMNGMGINEYFLATDLYRNVLTPTTGIDGIWTVWENNDKGLKANIFLAFESSQVKLAVPVVYDDNGEIIPPSERFNTSKGDIRYSISDNENENEITNSDGDTMAEVLTGGSVSMYSLRTWEDTDLEELTQDLIARGFKTKDVKKWIRDVNGIAAMIAADRDRLDYQATNGRMLKNNQEYVRTLDASTLCAKRLLYQGIYNEIQHMMPNTPLLPEDLINLINMMKKGGLVTPCGICYVESRRRMLGQYASEWLKTYDGAYKPTLEEVTTTDGLESLRTDSREDHRQAYDDFVAAMNAKGSANPKVVQLRTDYKPREIRDMSASQIQKVKDIGGLRVQSFSDFEVVHLIDMMQAVLDMAAMDLTSQAYTKVPEFAWVFGGTGIKINLSLIGKGTGVDANGNLMFDDVEGMPFEKAMELRQAYSENVGTILVGMNDEHIIAAMGDDRIDMIIPFHKSGWSKREMGQVIGMASYKDYTRFQNEKVIDYRKPNGGYKTIPNKKSKISNFNPVGKGGYWNWNHDGIWNAENYLKKCAEANRVPKFANFLIDNGDGSFRLPTETEAAGNTRLANIRKGYWKLLTDFKMYDNEGNGAEQQTVQPNFNMDRARDILNNYEGGANTLPTNHQIAQQFVDEYKQTHRRRQYSIQDEMDYDVQSWMETVPEWSLKTEAEKTLLQDFKSLRMKMQLDRERESQTQADIKKLEELLAGPTEGSVTRPETMENALEAAGVEIRPADPKKVLSNPTLIKNGKVIGFIYGNDRVRVSNKADPEIFEEMGFAVDRKTKMATYVNPEGNQMGNTATKKKLEALKVKLQNIRNTQEQTREKLAQITGNEGFGGMMYRQQQVLNDLLYNKTQGEVQDSVERMQKWADAVARTIEQNQKTIAEMEKGGIVQKLKEILGTTTAEQAVRELKQMTNSTWTRNEITPLFNEIVLKMTQGQEYQQEIENLAGILVNSSKDNAALDEDLSALRGMTLVISEGQLKELKGQGSSLKEIRQRLAGTGITVKTGEYSSLTDNLEDTIAEYGPAMFQDLGDEKDALENFVTRVEQRRNDAIISNQYAERLADTMAQIAAKAAGVAQGIYMPSDQTAQKQVLAMMEYVKGLAAQTQQAQKTLQGIADDMAAIQKEGRQASGMAGALARDVNVALDYYSRINQVAQQSARNQRQQAIIEQLKSKQAEKILKNNEEWRQLIARDAQARKQTEENAKTRGKINTVVKRMYNLLKNPKGTTNIPESMQGIARTVLESIVGNDLGGLKLTRVAAKDLAEISRVLRAWTERDGAPTMPSAGETSDDASLEIIEQDVQKIRDGISQYNADIRGANKVETLQQRGEILKGIQEALSEIYTRIRTENEVFVRGRQVQVANAAAKVLNETGGKNFKERTGFIGQKLAAMHKMIVSGNMTPEYFFRWMGNDGLTALWENYHDAENRNGLELAKSKARMEEIADRYGYSNWDMKTRQTVKLGSGDVQMTLGQIMSLWATWNREQQLGPEMSSHLTSGGFYAEEKDLREGILGKTEVKKRAHRVTEEDMAAIEGMLTQEQKNFVNAVVRYMSQDMSELGNEASMAAYGIKMYKEKYYFPMQMWDGIKSRKSNDAAQGASIDRAFHPSFSKSRTHGANNALVIGDFMQVATDHIAGMINYATMGLANESLQKVLNYTLTEGENAEEATKRNVRARLEEAYGQEAMQYLLKLQMQLNGGAVRIEKTIADKLISGFRKNAVAGSLSVALQQPLSYIRASMLINPKHLTKATLSEYWKDSYTERMKYSGVSVIKEMGRFDMNAGQSAREFLTPEGKESTGRKAWNKFEEYVTILPELMDRWTWNRMWVAVKAEQHAQHPEMNIKSDEFLTMCGERFNDIMRRTQVYDSTLVKSENMRNDHFWMRSLTSFMAEPTLTLNVLADAVRSAKEGETGGKALLGKAVATFALSAVLQAAFKGLMGSGRNPDDKKTWEENFLYRFFSALISEADPLQLIPGFSDLITLMKDGKLEDDALSIVGKMFTSLAKAKDLVTGKEESKGWYRDLEDTAGQLIQLFSKVPLKNIMRDSRAMYNFVTQPYAKRDTSGNVIANQAADLFFNADNFIGVINDWLGDSGYKTDNAAYKKRVYEAMRDGDETAAQNYIDYLLNGKGVKSEKSIMTGENGVTSYVMDDYQAGKITRTKADELLKIANPNMKDQDRAKKLDEVDYEAKTGEEAENFSLYTPLYDAMDQGNTSEIEAQKKHLAEVGVKESTISKNIKTHIRNQYEEGAITRKQAEEQYKKYAPGISEKDLAETLDEIDYEKETGTDVESYSLYTRIYAAVDKSDASTIKSQKNYLKTLGIEEKSVNSQIASYISSQYKEGKMKKSDAESKLKNYAGKDTNDIFWMLDRIDYTKQTGKKVDSTEKYYRLYDAMDANNSSSIQSAVKTITSHGTYESDVKKTINGHYKQLYLNGSESQKVAIQDAMQKAYKALGYTEKTANKTISNWKKGK